MKRAVRAIIEAATIGLFLFLFAMVLPAIASSL